MAPAGLFLLSGSTRTRSIEGANALVIMDCRKDARTQLVATAA